MASGRLVISERLNDLRNFFKPPLNSREFDLLIDTQTHFFTTLIIKTIKHKVFLSGCANFYLSDLKPPSNFKRKLNLSQRLVQLAEIAYVRNINVPPPPLPLEQKYRDLEKKCPNLSYHTLTTRESDTLHDKTYIQDYILSGNFEQKIGRKMHPEDTHIFLCGNPSMIGIPKIRDGKRIWPEGQKGVIQIMEERGFKMDYAKRKGNIHYEKYW